MLFRRLIRDEDIGYIVGVDGFDAAFGQLPQRPIKKCVLPAGKMVRAQALAVKEKGRMVDQRGDNAGFAFWR